MYSSKDCDFRLLVADRVRTETVLAPPVVKEFNSKSTFEMLIKVKFEKGFNRNSVLL
jgi:hypothetical protein